MLAPTAPAPFFLAGPTAVGKSAVAMALAERVNGEILSVDSMQVYRGLDIGTAKPTAAEQARVRHHLIDILDLTESFDAAAFLDRAKAAVQDLLQRGKTPVFCGGTGLYFKAWLEGLGEPHLTDPAIRAELESRPLPELLAELARRDPATHGRIDRQNPRRVVRALEIIRLTGQPCTPQRAPWEPSPSPHPGFFLLAREVEDLKQRIDDRVAEMFSRGLVAETRALLPQGLEQNRTALQAIGYRQVVEHLRGEHTLPETVELVKTRTRQYARRQMTWFRNQASPEWIQLAPDTPPDETAALLIKKSQPQTHQAAFM
jgi:tRNA dimethylallyltransferase